MCWPFHDWDKWEQYQWRGTKYWGKPIRISERRERRHCKKCGKEQDRLVRSG